jgi:membrane protease subunit (stomatin/prohibitin family)
MIVRRGRPGLIGTMARTAVVAGTATAVTDGMRERRSARDDEAMQAQMQQTAQEAAAPAAAAPAGVDVVGEIKKLADLKAAGALTEEEFAAAKAKLLA